MIQIISFGLIVGLLLGFVLQRGRFCVVGAYRDLLLDETAIVSGNNDCHRHSSCKGVCPCRKRRYYDTSRCIPMAWHNYRRFYLRNRDGPCGRMCHWYMV